jgi:hypothetical protein
MFWFYYKKGKPLVDLALVWLALKQCMMGNCQLTRGRENELEFPLCLFSPRMRFG